MRALARQAIEIIDATDLPSGGNPEILRRAHELLATIEATALGEYVMDAESARFQLFAIVNAAGVLAACELDAEEYEDRLGAIRDSCLALIRYVERTAGLDCSAELEAHYLIEEEAEGDVVAA